MSDLTEQLSSILSDPAGMDRIRAMAQSLLASNGQDTAPEPPRAEPENTLDLSKLAGVAQMLSHRGDDDRVRLLLALKPHLSGEKQQRVDKAVKMLKLLQLAPLLSQTGLFEL